VNANVQVVALKVKSQTLTEERKKTVELVLYHTVSEIHVNVEYYSIGFVFIHLRMAQAAAATKIETKKSRCAMSVNVSCNDKADNNGDDNMPK
jgi:hypothetical protein